MKNSKRLDRANDLVIEVLTDPDIPGPLRKRIEAIKFEIVSVQHALYVEETRKKQTYSQNVPK